MPLTPKGKKILKNMRKTYSTKDKAQSVFYAMISEGKITGVESVSRSKKKTRKK